MATLLTGEAADKKSSISRSLRHKLVKENLYPQPVKIGARRIAFLESEIDEWIAGASQHRGPRQGAQNELHATKTY